MTGRRGRSVGSKLGESNPAWTAAVQSQLGDGPDEDYYKANNFVGVLHRIKQFHAEYPVAARPPGPVKLQIWLEAYLKGDTGSEVKDDKALRNVVKKIRRFCLFNFILL
jgi:hypothetical protein